MAHPHTHSQHQHQHYMTDKHGRMSVPRAQYEIDLFWYVFNFGTLASGVSKGANVQIQADSDFEWSKTTFYAVLTGAGEPVAQTEAVGISINIVDTGTGRNLMYAPVALTTLAGNGQLPFIIPQPRIFKANAVCQMTAANFTVAGQGSGAQSYDYVSVYLVGRKIWKKE
jgi:hypothetical protein